MSKYVFTAVLLVPTEHLKEYPGCWIIKFTCTFHNLSCKNLIVFKVAPSIPRQPSILIQLLLHSDLKKLPIKFC